MSAKGDLFFPPFRLDPANAQLWRNHKEISLRHKSFDVLRYLVDRPGQLVTKAALLDALWPNVTVGDNLPASSIKELRKALEDDVRAPRFIETVHGRGYRFIASVTDTAAHEQRISFRDQATTPRLMVGRESELAQLQGWFKQVQEGRRLTLFVTGEAGIGKSTLLRSFVEFILPDQHVRIGHGQCIEQYGSGEPYMPVLEALSRLAREPDGEKLHEVLYRFAPTWLLQMPEILNGEERARLQSETQGVTQKRMLREMVQALDALSAEQTFVLLLEDLHFSDISTLELISAIARQSEPARIMIIGTYRLAEIQSDEHPLRALKTELELHRHCEELRLSLLSRAEIEQYLRRRLKNRDSPLLDTLAPTIHARTEGNPLFMVNMLDYLLADRALLVRLPHPSESDWAEKLRLHPLNSLRNILQMIEHNLERLTPDEQTVLEVASVVGTEFSAAAVAAALERPQSEIEACCIRLSRRDQFVSEQAPVLWPDGTVASGFRFHHALYQEALYGRLLVGQRAHFHRLVAIRQEAAYGGRAEEIATELANHYYRANLSLKAIQYFQIAGQRAISRAAVIEARDHFRKAIKLLHELPEGVARDRRELDLHLAIAPVLVAVIGGWHASETEQAWSRALELCERLGDASEPFPAMFGMYALYNVRGEIDRSNPLAKQLLSRAESTDDSAQMLYARIAVSVSSYFSGEFSTALQNSEICNSIYNFERDGPLMLHYGFDAGVWSLCFSAVEYWQLGYPAKALNRSEEALALSARQAHPLSLAQAELWTGILRQMRGEPHLVGEIADRLSAISNEHGLTDWLYWAECLRGWVVATQGCYDEGIGMMRASQEALSARGLGVWRPYFLCLLAEASLGTKRIDGGLKALDEAIEVAQKTQERAHESQIYRLKGELLLEQPNPDVAQALSCFEFAINIARKQGAKSFELQATTSLARQLARQGHRNKARAMLECIYNWFTEGFDTADLKKAKTLLDDLRN